jgi:hypothetical protein
VGISHPAFRNSDWPLHKALAVSGYTSKIMKFLVLTTALLTIKLVSAQNIADTNVYRFKTIQGPGVKSFIDSVRSKVLSDTIQFKRSDLIHTLIGTRNKNAYSTIFIVNSKYSYKLDILENKDVIDFVNVILVPEIIDSVCLIPATYCGFMFGENLPNGGCFIFSKIKSRSYFKISGLAKHKKQYNNFYQRREGELLVHD